ncbi:MAG: ImmA/IrrE family metallo-endopeptidase [Alphaproteobacteria bacterium]|nr:ImmA/IrrE family metallo-endopeptidase [Alphaproteobacteria bacterium]
MAKRVPYLHEEQIERDAAALLADYERARGVTILRAVPIEDIVEKYLKIGIEFDDMHRLSGVPRSGLGFEPDILGAIYFNERRIVIDESLDPVENPNKEGRYRFTLAHEVGHWWLHRPFFAKDPAQASFFNEPAPASVVCRSSQAKEPVEWQADFYASSLLMPRKVVMASWDEMFPDRRPRVIAPAVPVDHPFVELPRIECRIGNFDCSETDDNVLDRVARPLAEQFLVSPIAMRIRLEKLGLLHRTVPHQRIITGGA